MKIQPLNYKYSLNFSARRKDIRKADDIMRNAKAHYPMISSTFADEMYGSLHENKNAQNILDNIKRRIKNMREYVNSTSDIIKTLDSNSRYRTVEPLCIILDEIRKNKVGNCYESAQLGLSALYSNGYMNSEMASLEYKIQIIDKTGDTIYESFSPLDHCFVLTDMNKGGKKDVVIDPWLSFADSISGAKERFKKIYTDEELKKIKDNAIQDFKKQLMFMGTIINMENFIVKGSFYFNTKKHKGISAGDTRTKEILNLWHPKLKFKS